MDGERTKEIPKYSLNKSRKILKWCYSWYKKRGKTLPPQMLQTFERDLEACDHALLAGDALQASNLAEALEAFTQKNFKRTFLEYLLELGVALGLALVIACLVRMMWFEPYEIPTGSMRPTFKEQDHLTVTKTAFGINFPFETKHLYFDPHLIHRTGIVVFSADGIPIIDPDTTYFGLFPYKKRLIKRLIGKPGDSLYFYGGKIYGVDREGKPIEELLNSPWLKKIEYIPFLSFEGELSSPNRTAIQFEQMHQPIARLVQNADATKLVGEIFNGTEWVKDQPTALRTPHDTIKTYGDFLGMRNFAIARLLTKQELNHFEDGDKSNVGDGVLYLQLMHSPNLLYPKPLFHQQNVRFGVSLIPYTTLIPFDSKHLKALMDNMYTARFVVKNEYAKRYSVDRETYTTYNSPRFPGIPDGTYEFYYGKAFQIGWGGTAWELPKDHPLYSLDPANIQRLFNLGVDMNTLVDPTPNNLIYLPHRYAYFRDGDLYLLGAPVIQKDDPILIAFNSREEKKQKQSSNSRPYIAFKDFGPPLKDGKYDVGLIRALGITIPQKSYIVLGDNHAMSADSRVFGLVPENNLQGAPSLILWPPGPRWGFPAQKSYPIFVLPRLIVWGVVALIALISYIVHRRNLKRPIVKFQRSP
jgi:signal peptidase I